MIPEYDIGCSMKLSLLIYGLIYIAAGSQCYVSAFDAPSEDHASLSQDDPDWEDWDKEVRFSKRSAHNEQENDALDGSPSGILPSGSNPVLLVHTLCVASTDCSQVQNSDEAETNIKNDIVALYTRLRTFPDPEPVQHSYECSNDQLDTYDCLCSGNGIGNTLTVKNVLLYIEGLTNDLSDLETAFNFFTDTFRQQGIPLGQSGLITCESPKSTLKNVTNVPDKIRDTIKCSPISSGPKVNLKNFPGTDLGNAISALGTSEKACKKKKNNGTFTGAFNFERCNFKESQGVDDQEREFTAYSNYLLDNEERGVYISCVYQRNLTTDELIPLGSIAWDITAGDVTVSRRDLGTFSLKMGLYSDPLYMNELSTSNAIGQNDYIYGQVYALGIDMDINNLKFSLQNCYDSSAQLRFSDTIEQHTLIQDRCPMDDSYETIPTNQNDMYKFRFKPGTHYNLDDHLHLHCDIKICTVDDNSEDCKPPDKRKCARVSSRGRRALDYGKDVPISNGPISFIQSSKINSEETIFDRSKRSNDQAETTPVTFTPFVLLAVAIAAIAINVVMATIYILQSRTEK
ncbi:unnamed protein product [Owenia fusiformis]|uniref:ZP domain-containing protein n=1 Tax=Owenia fusiformis TaxID=6347 RepID=A0A8S4P7M4_OWEFU|nr:unnamed protein product [Owenia fusiformis]